MKKGDIVKRIHVTEDYVIDSLEIGDVGVILKGPYEKNISDIFYERNPRLNHNLPKFVEIKRVIDILSDEKVYKYRIAADYERVRT